MGQYEAHGPIALRPARDKDKWIIPNCWDQLNTIIISKDGETVLRVEPSKTDLASTPRVLWILTGGKTGRHQRAAVCHDFAYRNGLWTREECDQMFYDVMVQDGVGKFKHWWQRLRPWRNYRAEIMYRGVRMGGASSYQV